MSIGTYLISNSAEDNVFAIQPISHHGGDEELGAVCVRTGVSHGQEACETREDVSKSPIL